MGIILGWNFPDGKCSGGSYPGWEFSGWELSGGNHPGGNFAGGSFPSTKHLNSKKAQNFVKMKLFLGILPLGILNLAFYAS